MRRAVPSFTVEVRRRPRLATTSNPDAQSSETKSPQASDLIESRIVPRLRRSVRRRWIRPLLMWHRLQRAEFFRASSPTSRYVVAPRRRTNNGRVLTHLRGRQSDRRCGRRKAKIKHRSCPGTRDSRLTRTRRWLRDRRPSHVKRPACNQMKGQAFRQGSRRPRKVKLSETPAVRR